MSLGASSQALAQSSPASGKATQPCRIAGIANELQCGSIKRPLDPAQPQGTQIDVHFLIVPAMARNKQPDPVLMLAGGPGQSAIDIAPMVLSRLSRLNNRRDLVFIDQRGTGKSAPLQCADVSKLPVTQVLDPQFMLKNMAQCRQDLGKLPHGDLRQYSSTIAMQDFDAVRATLGAPQWNLIGASYGTRAALEYLRLFPSKVRRTVLDGVAPPDMVLPASFSTDGQQALNAMLQFCEKDAACSQQYPKLRQEWANLQQGLPRPISVSDPLTGRVEQFSLTREQLMRSVRMPLYSPTLASALPAAIHAASAGRWEGLLGLSGAMGSGKGMRMAEGMHFSVVCAEDVPRLEAGLSKDAPGRDFADNDAKLYTQVCKNWPRAQVAPEFFSIPPAPSPVLLLSGGADPATPPRHGERTAKALAAKNPAIAQHIVVPEAGHGVSSIVCMRDVLFRFIDAKTDTAALPQDAGCASKIPRPTAFLPVQSAAANAKVAP
ncbi:cysteine protease [Paucibacter sp. KBW04]|nr:cysteine protease [Paucibacter sp. KBW04]